MDSSLADAWEELAAAHDASASAVTGEPAVAHKAIAETYRKCARQLRQSGTDRSHGIQVGHGNTQTNVF